MAKELKCFLTGRMKFGRLSACPSTARGRASLDDLQRDGLRSSFMLETKLNDADSKQGQATLSAADLRDPEISAIIAAKLREFHNLDMPGPRNVVLWDRMRNWLNEAKNLCSIKDIQKFGLDTLEEEISMLEKELSQDYQEIGFCHNDLQYGNIMMDEETRLITIIDYEYASYNPVAYDLANHFCEMVANYHSDTPHVLDYRNYPGLEERQKFVRAYLSSADYEPSDAEVEQLVEITEKYTLANHLFWGLWGIISGYVNKIDFDYVEYARQRFQQYWLRKPALLGS
ncbi:probable choline kinase 3 isoform X2 [Pyrus x bretschneideri]|uniref:probable choline kinase 3 isoform X2 n=1 Tax=Pyrus x bretschneideri TaxID=225117 RepID=UPI0020303346|nr:probable choline kinase 3 isoform X2 [Pyrus x bretschneideri]